MKKLAVFVLVLSALGSMTFAQGLPTGATAWEYATLRIQRSPALTGDLHYSWYAYGVPDGIRGGFSEFMPELARQYGVDFEAVRANLPGGIGYTLNLVGLAGWELVDYLRVNDTGDAQAVLKRPRP